MVIAGEQCRAVSASVSSSIGAVLPDSKVDSLLCSCSSSPLDDVTDAPPSQQRRHAATAKASGASAAAASDPDAMISSAASDPQSVPSSSPPPLSPEYDPDADDIEQEERILTSPESDLDTMLPEVVLARNIRLIEALRLDLEVNYT